ncbi:MAG: SDR family NAD(P)-dependent oxidoreductase [Clostridia bacterium]|nr:SDR family NAD(P)-dependent oxidoreductase [Clostridia bacterium]
MKTVLITGASSGIGLAAARRFRDGNWRVFGLCRREFEEDGIEYIRCDVTDEEQVKAAFSEVEKRAGGLDVLVNCAGIGISGAAVFTEKSAVEKQIAVNFTAVSVCVRYAFPLLRNNRGRIINISSAAAVFAIPFQSFYSASKAALNSYSKALAGELRRFGISVTALMLGDTNTGFTAAREKSADGEDLYGGSIGRSVSVMEKDEKNGYPPEKNAEFIYRKAMKKSVAPVYTVGGKYKLLTFLMRLLPERLINFIIGKLYIK